MAFVRTKRVGDKEYRQLVENYREDGRHRQRVIAHLGKHETLENAIDAARAKLEAVDTTKIASLSRERYRYEQDIRHKYGKMLEKYHGREIPTAEEVRERAHMYRTKHRAPHTDELLWERLGLKCYAYAEVVAPLDIEEYRRAWGSVRKTHVGNFGSRRFYFLGLSSLLWDLDHYETLGRSITRRTHELRSKRQRLAKLERALEVVTKSTTAAPATAK